MNLILFLIIHNKISVGGIGTLAVSNEQKKNCFEVIECGVDKLFDLLYYEIPSN